MLTYVAMQGPTAMPMIEPLIQMSIAHILARALHISSIHPEPTTVGRAERKPLKNLPINTAGSDRGTPTMMQVMAKLAEATMFVGFRPKLSV